MPALEQSLAAVGLRPAVAEDESFLLSVYASTRADELELTNWTPLQKDAFVRMQFEAQRSSYAMDHPAAKYLVIQCNGANAGRMIIDRTETEILLMDIAVLPEFRRRRIATQLMAELQQEAMQTGKSIQLYVECFNPALQWYERLGFRTRSQGPIYLEMAWQAESRESVA